MGRAPCCDKANVKKGPWSPDEDAKLKTYIEKHGTGNNWIALPNKIGLKRCGKSCRLRWLNYLRPNIKHGGFSEEEDLLICSLYVSIGSRWSMIAAQLPGRTDNDIKNYWNTRLKKKLLGRRRDLPSLQNPLHNLHLPASTNHKPNVQGRNPNPNPNGSSQNLSSSALERLQLQGIHIPFSFFNKTSLCPNYKHLQTLNFTDPITVAASPLKHPQQANAGNSMITNLKENVGVPSLTCSNNLEVELHDLLYGYKENQPMQLDCLEGMNEEEGISWWGSNEFNEKSLSSSWDSASTLQPDALLIQDYVLGYDL